MRKFETMAVIRKTGFIIMFLIMVFGAYAQDSCHVLNPAIQESYEGGCKNGLAHGEGLAKGVDTYQGRFKKGLPDGYGTYNWANGTIYQGDWKKGKRSGRGTYSYSVDGRDTSIIGLWKDDEYIGKEIKHPQVTRSQNIDSYDFRITGGILERVLISFKQNGSQNTRVDNLMLNSSSGTITQMGQLKGFDNVEFPVTISVRYDTYNKMGTQKINSYIEFVIYEEGDWEVRLKN